MSEPPDRPPSFVRRHLATNVDDDDLLVGLACDENMWVRREAVQNPRTPRWVLDLLVRAGTDPELRGRRPPDPDLPADDLRRLVECGPWARRLVADHPNTAGDVLAVLAEQPNELLRRAVAVHPNSPAPTLARLCADPDASIRQLVAARPDTPGAALGLMRRAGAVEDLSTVRGGSTDAELEPDELAGLASLGPWGRFLAARHAGCPTDILASVAGDPDWRVRSAVLDNPNTPDEMLAGVAGLRAPSDAAPLRVSSQPDANSLAALVEHPQPEVRVAVARHEAVPADAIAALAVDRIADIRRLAARHPLMDVELLGLLVRAGSTDDLARLAPPDVSVTTAELDTLAAGGYWARQLAVRHPDTSSATLARLLCDDDPKLREWAAAHPTAPRDVVDLLLRAGAATDFQGIAPPGDPAMSHEELLRVSALGPYGELIVSWHPNAPEDRRAN